MPYPQGLMAQLPPGVWQDERGDFYSVDKRVGSWAIRTGHTYYRVDSCGVCGDDGLVIWHVDAEGGVECFECGSCSA